MITSLLISAFLACASGSVPSSQSPDLDDGDLAPLVEGLGEYLSARASGDAVEQSRATLVSRMAEFAATAGRRAPASQGQALGRALWLARHYDKLKLRSGKVTEVVSAPGTFAGGTLEYAYRVPREYDPARASYPLIVCIPDEDETAADHLRIYWSSAAVRAEAIVVAPRMPEERDEWDRVMVDGRPGGLCNVLTALRLAQEQFAVDFDRVYVTGRGKGVPVAIAAGNYSPHRFAGVVTRSGDLAELGPQNFSNLPTLLCAGGARARAFHGAAVEAGLGNCELLATVEEEAIWEWMSRNPRRAHPTRATVVVGQPFPTRVNWLRIAPISATAQATATIERDANRITIDGSGVSFATLYLSDELVDLRREVKVRCNGREQSIALDRQLAPTLDFLFDGTSDPGCVYTVQLVVDMRADAAQLVASNSNTEDTEFERYLADAEGNPDKLWELHLWCQRTARDGRSLTVLEQLLKLDGEHAQARAALNLQTRGAWEHSAAQRKRLDQGWILQDLEWVAPGDRPRVESGEWLVDGEWMGLQAANERHARISGMWQIPGPMLLLHSTAERRVSKLAMGHMLSALDDLHRVFGSAPDEPVHVTMLRDEEQYDRMAFGDPDGRRSATHAGRLHVIHSAFLAESWFVKQGRKSVFTGMGVGYWDKQAPGGDAYGLHSARLAAGLSFVDALDPSPKTVRKARTRGLNADYYADYQAEKMLPGWLRYGAAVYGERYFRDDNVAQDGDPFWARAWSLESLRTRGGLRPLADVLAFALDPDYREDGLKLYIEAGLLVAFIVDGECAPVMEAHQDFKRALAAERLKPSHLRDLEQALVEHETELRAFAGL